MTMFAPIQYPLDIEWGPMIKYPTPLSLEYGVPDDVSDTGAVVDDDGTSSNSSTTALDGDRSKLSLKQKIINFIR